MFNGDYHDMEQWLREGEVDLGFVTLPAPEGMRTIPLTQDPLVAIMPKNHRLAQLEEIPIQELGEDPFISLLQSSAHDIHRALDLPVVEAFAQTAVAWVKEQSGK